MSRPVPNFDLIARPYRWLEYLTLGVCLERCRFHFLARLADRRHALILGDGDGRFTAALLAANPAIAVHAVDSSAAMLRLLTERVARLASAAAERLHLEHIDALRFTPQASPYDLVVAHFFFDCLGEAEIAGLLASIQPHLAPGAVWLVSEFAIPDRQPMTFVATVIVGVLYRIFGLLTGLQVRRVPDYASRLRRARFRRNDAHCSLRGLLVSEWWVLESSLDLDSKADANVEIQAPQSEATASSARHSHRKRFPPK